MKKLVIKGAREHNLKNIDLELPRDSLIVISGMSGSGKSSLAFDTIYAEGQRRYVESLSSYARQFLGRMDKPDVDYIEGLSPAISIEQKTTHRNPRSTVGTVTEIYDYLRLLYARIGVPHCPECGKVIQEQSVDQIIDTILSYPEGTKIAVLAPVVRGKKGEHQKIFEDAKKAGFVRIRVNGEIRSLDEEIALDKKKKHSLEIVVDRMMVNQESRRRLSDSVETALEISDGMVIAVRQEENGEREEFFSQKNSCPDCGISLPEIQPRLFSFNNPFGACPTCTGLGITLEFDPDLVIPDKSLSINEGGIATANPQAAWNRSWFEGMARHYGFSLDTPFEELPAHIFRSILHGTDDRIDVTYVNKNKTGKFEYSSKYPGILKELKRRYLETTSEQVKEWLAQFMSQKECSECEGKRLRRESLAVTVGGRNIWEFSTLPVAQALTFLRGLDLTETERTIAKQILKEIEARLTFMQSVGLDYVTLERKASTLSGGEAQRIRLATQIGSSLVGVLYILDEPTIGLHQKDNQRLINTLKLLRDLGNTLIVVEHDEQTIRTADYIVDLGPGAGIHGGNVIAQGTLKEIIADKNSITGRFLSGRERIEIPERRRNGNGNFLSLSGRAITSSRHRRATFPRQAHRNHRVCGSGKSTLPAISSSRSFQSREPSHSRRELRHMRGRAYEGDLHRPSPIADAPLLPRNVCGVFHADPRTLRLLRSRGSRYKMGRFSFNVKGGRCEHCEGDADQDRDAFSPTSTSSVTSCKGKRFNRETWTSAIREKTSQRFSTCPSRRPSTSSHPFRRSIAPSRP
jgi:excinuclease ABC subunit A